MANSSEEYSPYDAEKLWASSVKGKKLAHYELWPRIPFMPIGLKYGLPRKEIFRIFMKASDCILRWYTIEWPLIPIQLAKKLESNGEHYRLMNWEMEIRKNMLKAYYPLTYDKYCEIKDHVKLYMPAAPVFDGDYTAEDRRKIQEYAEETAGNYLCLVPRTGNTKDLTMTPSVRCDLEHWRYATYKNFTCKPEPVTKWYP